LSRPEGLHYIWTARPEIDRIWLSLYTPQIGEQSAEMLTPDQRQYLLRELPVQGESTTPQP